MTRASLSISSWRRIRFSTLSTSHPQSRPCSSSIYRHRAGNSPEEENTSARSGHVYQTTDLLAGPVSDLLQLSDQSVDHQRPLQLLPVTVQISVKLAPPGRERYLVSNVGAETTDVRRGVRALPLAELLSPLSDSRQLVRTPSLLQSGC